MKGFENDYDRRLRAVIARRTAPVEMMAKSARMSSDVTVERYQANPNYEIYNSIGEEGSAVRYTVASMARLDPRYTEITYEQGDRVKNQLDKGFSVYGFRCDFEYQGSVTNDTHIKSYSDIDLLSITQRFITLEHPQVPTRPYKGNPINDLREIRETGADALSKAFPKATVDKSGSKSVSISGGSLSRKIDVVPANWFDTNAYAKHQAKRFRAIEVLDNKSGSKFKNTPFMHNYLIEKLDRRTQGGLRKSIRLFKSLKYDSDSVSLSSYDLAALAYNMPEGQLFTNPGGEIPLLARLKVYLDFVRLNKEFRLGMLVPDESRKVFAPGHATLTGLNELQDEVDDLVEAVCSNRKKSFEKLAEARLAY